MKYIYGPVRSRRLGLSLGVSLTEQKTCNFNCLYCQLGPTSKLADERAEYVKISDVMDELKSWLKENPKGTGELKFITISGSGEPTLNSGIIDAIDEIKKVTNASVAVITNSSLLNNADVRKSLLRADLIVPSLDSASPKTFRVLDRPHPGINIDDIIEGLVLLRKEFRGSIWLEVMLVKGVNDDLAEIRKLKTAIDRINPDKIQLNSPVRTTAKAGILPVDKIKLKKIKEILGDKCEVV